MRIDLYTKLVLTVIAVSLATIASKQIVQPAVAFNEGCGDRINPCHIKWNSSESMKVEPAPYSDSFTVQIDQLYWPLEVKVR
jgi:hypothetical protein